MKAFLLARVSDPEQRKALPAQTQRLLSYAKQKDFEHLLFEFDESAYSDARQKFREVVKLIEESEEPVVVVFDKIDRYTRDSTASEVKTLDKLRKQGKIELHFPSDNLFVTKDSPAHDLFRLGIGIALAQYYSDSIRDNVKRRFEQMLNDGIWPHMAPSGYLNITISEDKKDIILDPDRSRFMKKAFEMYASGNYSVAAIVKVLTKEGLRTRLGKEVTHSQMDEYLQNPFYYGEMVENGKLYPHKYEKIIDRWLFEKCRAVREGRHKTNFKYKSKPQIFRGLIKCAYCGCMVNPDTKKGKYTYLKCNQYKGKDRCQAIRVREQVILDQVMDILRNLKIPEDAAINIEKELKTGFDSEQEYFTKNINRLREEYDASIERVKVMYKDRLAGRITTDEYDEYVKDEKQKQHDLNEQMKDHTEADENFLINASLLIEVSSRAAKIFEESSEVESKRQLLNFLLSNCTLEGEKLLFDLKAPFDAIYQANKTQVWLPLHESIRNLSIEWQVDRDYLKDLIRRLGMSRRPSLLGAVA